MHRSLGVAAGHAVRRRPEQPPPAGQTSESEASNALQYLYVDPHILSLPKFYHVSLCIK